MGRIEGTYNICKDLIKSGGYDYYKMAGKLDAYLAVDHITMEDWQELTAMLAKPEAEDPTDPVAEETK